MVVIRKTWILLGFLLVTRTTASIGFRIFRPSFITNSWTRTVPGPT